MSTALKQYALVAHWGPRPESADACAVKLQLFLRELVLLHSLLSTWFEKGYSRKAALEQRAPVSDLAYLKTKLLKSLQKTSPDRRIMEQLGFSAAWWNGQDERRSIGVMIFCGAYSERQVNSVVINFPDTLGVFADANLMAEILALVARVWRPDWAGVISSQARDERPKEADGSFVDWMIYKPVAVPVVPAPSRVVDVPGAGSIVIVQPDPPKGDDPEELVRIDRVAKLLKRLRS